MPVEVAKPGTDGSSSLVYVAALPVVCGLAQTRRFGSRRWPWLNTCDKKRQFNYSIRKRVFFVCKKENSVIVLTDLLHHRLSFLSPWQPNSDSWTVRWTQVGDWMPSVLVDVCCNAIPSLTRSPPLRLYARYVRDLSRCRRSGHPSSQYTPWQ